MAMYASVSVWSSLGCFSMPEYSVERMSYPVPPFSAAQQMLGAIYAKHQEFSWEIVRIHVMNPINYFTMRFNEVNSMPNVKRLGEFSIQQHRTQRHTTALVDPHYVIVAKVAPARVNGRRRGPKPQVQKHLDIFNRRVKKGACFFRPFMGMRDFPADFRPAPKNPKAIPVSMSLGAMPIKVQYAEDDLPTRFAPMTLNNGVVQVEKGVRA